MQCMQTIRTGAALVNWTVRAKPTLNLQSNWAVHADNRDLRDLGQKKPAHADNQAWTDPG
jgi:hypothetical protein